MAIEPEVLLLDEPTANLDPNATKNVEELIMDIIHKHGTTIIMATHDMSQGQRLADRIGVLINGELHQTGDQSEVFTSPKNREVAEFVGVENIHDGIISSNEQGIVDIEIMGSIVEAISDYAVGEKVCACVRPEEITISLSQAQSSARNVFTGQITRLVTFGPLTRIDIDCGFRLVALVTKKSAEELSLDIGQTVYATFKATGVHVFKRDEK
jgi:tungstate transport system ATP-binding protein